MAVRPSRAKTAATHRALPHVNSDVGAFLNIVGDGLALFNANDRKRFSLFCSRNAWAHTQAFMRRDKDRGNKSGKSRKSNFVVIFRPCSSWSVLQGKNVRPLPFLSPEMKSLGPTYMYEEQIVHLITCIF